MFKRKDSLLYQFISDTSPYFSCHIIFNFFCLPESNLVPREGVEVLWLKISVAYYSCLGFTLDLHQD